MLTGIQGNINIQDNFRGNGNGTFYSNFHSTGTFHGNFHVILGKYIQNSAP